MMRALGLEATTVTPPAATIWSAADSPGFTVSGGALVATQSINNGSTQSVVGTTGKSSGKWHFEILVNAITDTLSYPFMGIANAAGFNHTIGFDGTRSAAWVNASGFCSLFIASANQGNGPQNWTPGDTVAIELDLVNNLIFVQRSGGSRSSGISISSLTGAPFFPACATKNIGDQVTANFGASAFAIAPTAGFSAWG